MGSSDLMGGGRQVGIVFLIIWAIFGIIALYWIPTLSKPILYKIKQRSFVQSQGFVSKVVIYESDKESAKRHGSTTVTSMASLGSAYYIRLWVDYAINGKPFQVDIKRYKGQHESLQEAFGVARAIAPKQDITIEFYRKRKVEQPDDIAFLKHLRPPRETQKLTPISFTANPRNPFETSLSGQPVLFPMVALLIAVFLMYIIPLAFAWFALFYFGKWKVLSSVLVAGVIGINILTYSIIKKHSAPDDYRLQRKPFFSFTINPDYTFYTAKPYIDEEE